MDCGRFTEKNEHRTSFKTIPYGINVACERLQNNLALMVMRCGPGFINREAETIVNHPFYFVYIVLDRKPWFFGQKFEIRNSKSETMTEIIMLE
jgi:hypothetical protein